MLGPVAVGRREGAHNLERNLPGTDGPARKPGEKCKENGPDIEK